MVNQNLKIILPQAEAKRKQSISFFKNGVFELTNILPSIEAELCLVKKASDCNE